MELEQDNIIKTILLVEDDPWLEKLVSATISRSDFKLIHAKDGEEAITVAVNENPNLILLDVNMPKLDGFEVCKILRGKEQFADIPILFLTAKSEPADIEKGFASGGTAYMTKPFSPLELLSTIERILEENTRKSQAPKSQEKP